MQAITRRENTHTHTLYDKICFHTCGHGSEHSERRNGKIKVDAEWQISQPPIQNKRKTFNMLRFSIKLSDARSSPPRPRLAHLPPGARHASRPRSPSPTPAKELKISLAHLPQPHFAGWPNDLLKTGVGSVPQTLGGPSSRTWAGPRRTRRGVERVRGRAGSAGKELHGRRASRAGGGENFLPNFPTPSRGGGKRRRLRERTGAGA